MPRLLIHVEGETEETFVREVLAPHLQGCGYERVAARLMGNARNRSHRGGICSWPVVRDDIIHRLREDAGSIATTMVDYYALPESGGGGWPQRQSSKALPYPDRGPAVAAGMEAEINLAFAAHANPNRFVGFVLMHEFEALLFSDCTAFANGIGYPEAAAPLQAIRNAFLTPEHINDHPHTAPSKRVTAVIDGYEKPIFGTVGALSIGLPQIRTHCPHFDDWVTRLEALAG